MSFQQTLYKKKKIRFFYFSRRRFISAAVPPSEAENPALPLKYRLPQPCGIKRPAVSFFKAASGSSPDIRRAETNFPRLFINKNGRHSPLLFTAFADHKTFGGCANHTKQTRPMPFVVFIKFKWNSGPSCGTEAIAVDILHRLINQFRGKSPRIITAR